MESEEKFIKNLKWRELLIAILVTCLCVQVIWHLACDEWQMGITGMLCILVAVVYYRQTRSLRVMIRYIDVLEGERRDNEERIRLYKDMCSASEEMIKGLKRMDENNCKAIDSQEGIIREQKEIIDKLKRELSDRNTFIPNEASE